MVIEGTSKSVKPAEKRPHDKNSTKECLFLFFALEVARYKDFWKKSKTLSKIHN